MFLKNISFHGILLDALFDEGNTEWLEVSRLLSEGIESGAVQPIATTVYGSDEIETAFRYMAQGKHIGKVLIKVRYRLQYNYTVLTSCTVQNCSQIVVL